MTGLLDGDLQEVFGSVFAPLLLDVTISNPATTYADNGDVTEGVPDTASAKGMVEEYSETTRNRASIPTTHVKLIVLQKGVTLRPNGDSTITVSRAGGSEEYAVYSDDDGPHVSEDPAQAAWEIRAYKVR